MNFYEAKQTVESLAKELKTPPQFFIADNKQIFSSNVYNRKTIKQYNGKKTAEEHFKIILENNYHNDDKKIKCINDALHLYNNDGFPKGTFIYRGQVNEHWELKPTLFRKYPKNANRIEMTVCENLILGEQSFFQKSFDPLEHLINCQHFNVSTRLLDWTLDLLTALFFACYDEEEKNGNEDGALYCLFKEQFSPLLVNDSNFKELKKPIDLNNIEFFNNRLQINEIKFIEPILKNPRLRAQDGCFLFFPFLPISFDDKKYADLLSLINARNEFQKKSNVEERDPEKPPIWIAKIKIDKISKKQILRELENDYGITKDTLYVNNVRIKNIERYYLNLYEKAILKNKELLENEL